MLCNNLGKLFWKRISNENNTYPYWFGSFAIISLCTKPDQRSGFWNGSSFASEGEYSIVQIKSGFKNLLNCDYCIIFKDEKL